MVEVNSVIQDGQIGGFADFKTRPLMEGKVKRVAVKDLPLIDFSPFMNDASFDARQKTACQLREACINIGFFMISGHGIEQSELDELIDWGHRLFALPLEDKENMGMHGKPGGTGYVRLGGNQKGSAEKTPDVKERFFMARERLPGEPDGPNFAAGTSVWPDHSELPGLTGFMKSHIEKRTRLARQIVRAFALSLELDEGYFDDMYRYPGITMLFNYYPALAPDEVGENEWSFSPHTDYGMFTILAQDKSGGLQARNVAGEWIDVPPVDGALVINIGDMFAMWTNDFYKSNLHRVQNYTDQPRISAPMFTYPQSRTEISCLPTCQGPDNPARYRPVNAEDYNNMLVAQSHRTGRPGISTKTAARFDT
ncbi:MAG: 2-oxoglutarate and iron-dependent oxygenase domain-containing protein [Rhodospirillales bacterium]|nr:2-oxoglutarate and iron-dependent oxygenase domain-containing protein [Rhodospirillales bacterium]